MRSSSGHQRILNAKFRCNKTLSTPDHGKSFSSAITGDNTFDTERLATAIDTRDRSYRLLMWISDAIDKNLILTSRASRHSGGPEAATDWLRRNYHGIPEELRPAESEIGEFAAFFSTYITSSFDIKEQPGTRGVGPAPVSGCGCFCPICIRMVNAPHLQAKKLYARDKQRARILMAERVAELAKNNGIRVSDEEVERIVSDADTRRGCSLPYLWALAHPTTCRRIRRTINSRSLASDRVGPTRGRQTRVRTET